MKAIVPSVGLLLLLAVVAVGIGTAQPQDAQIDEHMLLRDLFGFREQI